jgi:hypothetical protein
MSDSPLADTAASAVTITSPSPSANSMALTEFTIFPDLPIELRRKIYKHALRADKRRMILVKANKLMSSEESSISHVSYALDKDHLKDNAWLADCGFGILKACKESRLVYHENCKHFLSTALGKIYFDNRTVICITNYIKVDLNLTIPEHIEIEAAHKELFHYMGSLERIALLTWRGHPTRDPPEGGAVVGIPRVSSKDLVMALPFTGTKVNLISYSCLGLKKDVQAFEEALEKQETLGMKYKLSNPFYLMKLEGQGGGDGDTIDQYGHTIQQVDMPDNYDLEEADDPEEDDDSDQIYDTESDNDAVKNDVREDNIAGVNDDALEENVTAETP